MNIFKMRRAGLGAHVLKGPACRILKMFMFKLICTFQSLEADLTLFFKLNVLIVNISARSSCWTSWFPSICPGLKKEFERSAAEAEAFKQHEKGATCEQEQEPPPPSARPWADAALCQPMLLMQRRGRVVLVEHLALARQRPDTKRDRD